MSSTSNLTAIAAQLKDGYLVIPAGMVPRHAHQNSDLTWIVHVEGWTGAGEFDNRHFDLYSIAELPHVTIEVGECGVGKHDEQWFSFGKPTKTAIKGDDGLIVVP